MENQPLPPASPRSTPIPRRRFLRGMGLALGVPAFQSLLGEPLLAVPLEGQAATGAPLRMAFMSIPNGVQQDHWFPTGSGRDFQFNTTMAPLAGMKEHLQVLTGLKHDNATPGDDGAGDHARSNATFLTGARARKTAGKDIHVGVSIDQLAAQHLGNQTRFRSLELTCDAIRNTGSCDSGYACAYQYNLAWSTPTTPVTPEPNPRLAFERLFGAGAPGERRQNYALRQATQRSVLDFVLDDARSLQRDLGQHDRRKFDEYLAGVRSLEQRIERSETLGAIPEVADDTPAGIPHDFGEHMRLMYDMLVLAFQTDSTRVATLLLAYDGSNRSFPHLGFVEGHHYMTHVQRNPAFVKNIAAIDRYYMQYFAEFLEKLAATEDVDGNSILHNSMIVYGGAISDGNRHRHDNLPVILAGAGGGRLTPGRYTELPDQPMSNLFVTMLGHMGVHVDHFGDSDGMVDGI